MAFLLASRKHPSWGDVLRNGCLNGNPVSLAPFRQCSVLLII